MINVPDGALVALVGPAGAGKYTFAATAWPAPGFVISSDPLRAVIGGDVGNHDRAVTAEVFQVVHQLARMRLSRGLTTVVDATSASWHSRRELLRIAAAARVPAIAVIVLPPLPICLARNAARDRVVPEDVVRRQHAAVAQALPGLVAEGFAQVILAPPIHPQEKSNGGQ